MSNHSLDDIPIDDCPIFVSPAGKPYGMLDELKVDVEYSDSTFCWSVTHIVWDGVHLAKSHPLYQPIIDAIARSKNDCAYIDTRIREDYSQFLDECGAKYHRYARAW